MNDLVSSRVFTSKTKIIFVDDFKGDDHDFVLQSLIDECPFEFVKLKSVQINLKLLKDGHNCHWIFGNFTSLNPELIPTIVGNTKYSIVECEYKFCRYKSPEKHQNITGLPCDCHNQMNGKIISAFFQGAQNIWWMSDLQKQKYITVFPFLSEKDNYVLSPVVSKKDLGIINLIRKNKKSEEKWILFKNEKNNLDLDAATQWCANNKKQFDIVAENDEFLIEKLMNSEGIVLLPKFAIPANKTIVYAKLLGCKIQLNKNVESSEEEWFSLTPDEISDYIFSSLELFWKIIKNNMNYTPTISGYTTTYNCIDQQYPFIESIQSMLGFCDEVCVVDGGSTDGTWERLIDIVMESKGIRLSDLSEEDRKITLKMSKPGAVGEWPDGKKIRIMQVARDWEHPRHAVFDGLQKAEARKLCTKDYCWQMDADEIVHQDDFEKIKKLTSNLPKDAFLVSLPVVDFWGEDKKVRCDVNPWKWRLSKNVPWITHGIPKHLRKLDNQGNIFASQGTDGCDYIHNETGEYIPHINFYSQEAHVARIKSLTGDKNALSAYQDWFNAVINSIPSVFHYSWVNIERKIKTYKNYWQRHWESLYDIKVEDTAQNNMFFDKPWSSVSDDEIKNMSKKLSNEMGGWIFHQKVNFNQKTPHINITRKDPLTNA